MTANQRIYYEDQSRWTPTDFQGLWRYFNRLFQYIGPSPQQQTHPEHRASKIQARRTGKRDEELAALDLDKMSHETKYLMKHMLIAVDLYDLALERFENLAGLEEVVELEYPLILDENPTLVDEYYSKVGIVL